MTGAGARRARWAISFADLCLLMLGFFVLLQASAANRTETLRGIGAYFGRLDAPRATDLVAASLFLPGEALLSESGRARLGRLLAGHAEDGTTIRIQSFGLDRGAERFDDWDLAAARLGAVARAARNTGIAPSRIVIAGLAEADAATPGQTIRIVVDDPAPAR